MRTSVQTFCFIVMVGCAAACCLQGQQPEQTTPGTPATPPPAATAPSPAQPTAPLQPLSSDQPAPPQPWEHWDVEVLYWLTSIHPSLHGGAAAPDYENLDYPGKGQYTPGISLSFPVSKTTMLNFSGFVSKGSSNTTLSQAVDVFGTTYSAGDFLANTYRIENFKLSLQDLFFPFPRKEGQTWRIKTLWELQYDNISTNVNAPLLPTTDSSGNTIDNAVAGSRFVVYPTFGLAGDYHLTENLALHLNGSGFTIPHHSTIGDVEGSIGYRMGAVELIVAEKYYHFKTSTQNSEYFKTTLDGAYVALRWYPEKFAVPCPFCRGGSAAAQNDGSSAPATESTSTSTLASTGAGAGSSSTPSETTYIRRISGGATVSVLGFSLIPKATSTMNNSSTMSTAYDTEGASSRLGYGVTAQVTLTDHFAVAVEGLLRRVGYQLTTTVTTTTTVNEVTTTTNVVTHEDTRSRLIDIPAALRFYNRGRHTAGTRFFVEGGGAFRDAGSVRTSVSTLDASGVETCCTDTPTRPAHKDVEGIVAGVGLLLIDPLGIRIIPEVRYTRWMNPIFDAFTTDTNRNEVAAGFSLSF